MQTSHRQKLTVGANEEREIGRSGFWRHRRWYSDGAGFALGAVRFVQVEPATWVANMIGQHGLLTDSGTPPVRYDAVAQCLDTVAGHASTLHASVHMPRIGTGLAGGDWSAIEPIIVRTLCARDIPTTVYDLG